MIASSFPVPLPNAYVHTGGCPDGTGAPCASPDPSADDVWIPIGLGRFALAHELGHRFDAELLNDGDRVYFQRLMRAPAGAWQQETGMTGHAGPNEWFADYYAACAIGMRFDGSTLNYGSYADIRAPRLHKFCPALQRLSDRYAAALLGWLTSTRR